LISVKDACMNLHRHFCLRIATFCAGAWVLLLQPESKADFPRVGLIDFYGLKRVKKDAVIAAVPLRRGDPIPVTFPEGSTPESFRDQLGIGKDARLPLDTRAIEKAILEVNGVLKSKAAVVCCEADGTATVFVGIQEEGAAPLFKYRKTPAGRERLDASTVELYDRFTEALSEAVQTGTAREDDSEGHPQFASEPLKTFPKQFIALAEKQKRSLVRVLAHSGDAKHRAIAAMLISYSDDKPRAVGHLLDAVRDPDELVRNNATRSIGTISALAIRRPELRIEIPPAVFLKMLSSLSWHDRNKATMVLLALSERRDASLLRRLQTEALPELVEMARWKDSHSLMPLLLLGRVAGIPDSEVNSLWTNGNREKVIETVQAGR
jgi:hypothetical protein